MAKRKARCSRAVRVREPLPVSRQHCVLYMFFRQGKKQLSSWSPSHAVSRHFDLGMWRWQVFPGQTTTRDQKKMLIIMIWNIQKALKCNVKLLQTPSSCTLFFCICWLMLVQTKAPMFYYLFSMRWMSTADGLHEVEKRKQWIVCEGNFAPEMAFTFI